MLTQFDLAIVVAPNIEMLIQCAPHIRDDGGVVSGQGELPPVHAEARVQHGFPLSRSGELIGRIRLHRKMSASFASADVRTAGCIVQPHPRFEARIIQVRTHFRHPVLHFRNALRPFSENRPRHLSRLSHRPSHRHWLRTSPREDLCRFW